MVDYRPRAPMNTTNTVATAVQRRWACNTRTVLPADASERQRCNVVLSACSVVSCGICPVSCVLVREGNKNRQILPVRTYWYKIGIIQRNPGNRLIHSQRKKNFESPPRELQCSDRARVVSARVVSLRRVLFSFFCHCFPNIYSYVPGIIYVYVCL